MYLSSYEENKKSSFPMTGTYAIPDGTGHICGFLGGSCDRTGGSVSGVRQVRSFHDGGGSFCCSLTRRSFC